MFKKDSLQIGSIVGFGSIIVTGSLIYLVFYLFNIPLQGNMRFGLLAFVPDILFLRYYIRKLHYMQTGKPIAAILCILMLAVLILLIKSGEI